ncbi:malonyl-CoA synthase [Bradyrhizobium sp. ARR65]|uniref:malonate--CoA ligase n=1 Tax=Bradyrhizobium sp. ARR65 TaxID=1040989 RepID=UPI000465E4B5|nr:malonyl-CoA synthase [Bradyrhizobium sp. ARR65]
MSDCNLFSSVLPGDVDSRRVAIELPDGRTVSYGQLIELSGCMANLLVGRGMRPGDRLAAQVEKSFEALVLYLATVRAGGVYLPLNTAYTPNELQYFLKDAEPTIVVCDPSCRPNFVDMAAELGAVVETLGGDGSGSLSQAATAETSTFGTVGRAPDDLAAVLYTSGTTGRSKGAMLTHGNLISNARTLVESWQLSDRDVLIHMLPIYHTHGLFVASNVTLMAGARMIFRPRFDAGDALALMPRATVLMGVPTFYVRLLKLPGLRAASERIRLFVSGSAPLPAQVHQQWRDETGHSILERYGMTETGMNTSNPYSGERVPGTVGLPLPGVKIRVAHPENGRVLGQNEVGVVEVSGPNVFKGYWRMPEKTASEFREDGFFVTGDLGRIDERGYLHIVGRGKDLIITGGFNVYPKEVEAEIDAIGGVVESAVIGLPHPEFGEGVTAAVVRAPGSLVDEDAILKAVSDRLAKFKQPKRVVFVEALPRNTMGKVQKNLLRENLVGLYGEG